MNPVTESRFLPPFLATTASIVLVCGGLLLLTSTAPWTSREEAASDASVPRSAERAAKPSPPAQIALAPSTSAGGFAGAETPEADHGENTQVVEAPQADTQQAAPRPAHDTAAADVPGANDSETHASDVPQADEDEDTSDGPQVDETEAGAMTCVDELA